MKDNEGDKRSWAVEALGKIGDFSAVPELMEGLKDRKGYMRESTAKVLAEMETLAQEQFFERQFKWRNPIGRS